MVSYAIVHRHGVDRYLGEAAAAGVDGLIVPDLPVEEADGCCRQGDRARPQPDPARHADHAARPRRADRPVDHRVPLLRLGGRHHRRADGAAADLVENVAWLRTQTDLPICIGFGISRPSTSAPSPRWPTA